MGPISHLKTLNGQGMACHRIPNYKHAAIYPSSLSDGVGSSSSKLSTIWTKPSSLIGFIEILWSTKAPNLHHITEKNWTNLTVTVHTPILSDSLPSWWSWRCKHKHLGQIHFYQAWIQVEKNLSWWRSKTLYILGLALACHLFQQLPLRKCLIED